ncbi:MAG TPA: AMP-binding protein [Burkholderiales bacterium]|nr:AMP-binding protein [Burkholderiales bacterium]
MFAPTIPHALVSAANRLGDKIFAVDAATRMSYSAMRDAMLAGAGAFAKAGVQPGDRVAVWAPNSVRFIEVVLSLQAAGASLVPLNTRFKASEVGYILKKSRARFIVLADRFLDADYLAMLDEAASPHIEKRIVLGDAARGDSWEAFVAGAGPDGRHLGEKALAALRGDAISDIMFTSGTTGNPKGVVTTHEQNLRVYTAYNQMVGMAESDRYIVLYPFFHTAGYKAGWLATILVGATIYPEAVFDPPKLLAKLAAERITVLPGPPTLFQTILAIPKEQRPDLSAIRLAQTGASVVPPELVKRMREDLGFASVLTGYGLTETCGTVSLSEATDSPETTALYSGHPLPGTEARVVDENGKVLPPGEPGEILVRGYNLMQCYFEDEKATAEAIDKDGWLHTGDIGVMNERNYIRITDRKKDMFIVGGFNCYPAEIEQILLTNTSYMQVAVVGVPDELMGEVGKAFIVPKPGEKFTADDVIAWSRKSMANYKVPRYVEIVEALPTNATGKIQRFKLKEAGKG